MQLRYPALGTVTREVKAGVVTMAPGDGWTVATASERDSPWTAPLRLISALLLLGQAFVSRGRRTIQGRLHISSLEQQLLQCCFEVLLDALTEVCRPEAGERMEIREIRNDGTIVSILSQAL